MKRRYIALIIIFVIASTYLELSKDKTDGSSFSYKPNGSRAFFLLLEKMHLPLEGWLYPFSELSLEDRKQALLIVNPKKITDTNRLLAWVASGNRLLVFGKYEELWDKFLLNDKLTSYRSLNSEARRTAYCSDKTAAVCKQVEKVSGLSHSFESYSASSAEVIVGSRAEGYLAKIDHKAGEIWLFSSQEIISNEFIDRDDNLRFLFQIVSASDKVLFDEFHHGYFAPTTEKNKQSFEAAIIFIALFAAIVILATLSRAIRFGPALAEEEKSPAIGTEFASVLGLLYHEHSAKVLENYIQAWKARSAKKFALSSRSYAEKIIADLEQKNIIAKGTSKNLYSSINIIRHSKDNKSREQALAILEEAIK